MEGSIPQEEPRLGDGPEATSAGAGNHAISELLASRTPGGASLTPRFRLRRLALESARVLRVSRVGVWRFEEGGARVRLVTRYNRSEGGREEDVFFPAELAPAFHTVLERVSALAVDDTEREGGPADPLRAWLKRETIRAVLAVPVRSGGRLSGFVTFEERRSPRSWTAQDRDVAAWLALQVGPPLDELLAESPPPAADADVPEPLPQPPGRAQEASATGDAPGMAPSAFPSPEPGRQTQVRRVSHLEAASLIGGQEAEELLDVLDVQEGYLRMLEATATDRPEDLDLVRAAREAANRVRDGLLRFLGCMREKVPERLPVDLNQLLPGMIPALAREVGEGARLRIAPTSAPLPVEANSALLERAMVHLVQNAREASGAEGTVRVSWGPATRPHGGAEAWEGARIRVEDQGEGISRHDLPWLFEPFFSRRTEPDPLRGLGLCIVQAIVEGHGGWIEVHSRVGEGTDVDLFLPLASPAAEEREREEWHGTVDDTAGIPRARIVVLEDNPRLADLIVRILARDGYDAEAVSTPVETERRLRGTHDRVDLVIVARSLAGGRSGVELASLWRAREPDLPVVLMDRRSWLDAAGKGRAPDASAPVIRPPFDPETVVEAVEEALRNAATPPSPAEGGRLAH